MRISLNWIRRLLSVQDLGVSAQVLGDRLTMHLTAVEGIERIGPDLDRIVVGKVLTCGQHPNADRLRVTTVDVGQGTVLPIVCGAPNVAVGQTVAVATEGAKVTFKDKIGQAKTATITKSKLRGADSHGLFCAEDELGLGDQHEGILVLPDIHAPGTPLAQVLGGGDEVLIVENQAINHRPDLWGHLGWAREIAALLGLQPPVTPSLSRQVFGQGLAVDIRSADCRAYCGAVVEGVANRPSPRWMQDLLVAAGLRPLGLLVDITNFVMLELGEPMHAFDRRSIAGEAIIVRSAAAGETLTTLDGTALILEAGDLVIADRDRNLALAGIMGGAGSMVRDDTSTIVLEAACFAAMRIRRTRVRTGLSTDSSTRFEKHLYPHLTGIAIDRAIALLVECCPGSHVTCRFENGAQPIEPFAREIPYDPARAERLVGIPIPADQQWRSLVALGCQRVGDQVRVPWWRGKDLEGAADLIEEVARLHGFHQVQPQVPSLPAAAPAENRLRASEHRLRTVLSALGWDEVATYGFANETWTKALACDEAKLIRLAHPLSSEETVLRPSLLPNLIRAAVANLRHLPTVQIYEIGKRYAQGIGTGETPDEVVMISGVAVLGVEPSPFYAARDAALEALAGLGFGATVAAARQTAVEMVEGRAAVLTVGKAEVGRVAELPAALRRLAGCDRPLAWFEIDLERVMALPRSAPVAYRTPSRFQPVDRDFTFVCQESVTWRELERAVASAAGTLLRSTAPAADIYRGEGIPAGAKAVSVRCVLQAEDRTLSDDDLKKTGERIVAAVAKATGATLRA